MVCSAARWQVLGFLADGPGTAAELARRRGLRRQSVQESVNRLLAQGLIERGPNPADARAPLLSLTAKSRLALEQLDRAQHTWASALAARQSRQDLETALAVLRTLREALEEG